MNNIESQILEFRRLMQTTTDDIKLAQMEAAISSLQSKLDSGMTDLEEVRSEEERRTGGADRRVQAASTATCLILLYIIR